VSRHSGQASMPANRLNSAALPSITGSAAFGPMLPRPRTAEPSVTTATLLRLIVSRRASSGLARSPGQTARHPGCRSSTGRHGCGSGAWRPISFCREVDQERRPRPCMFTPSTWRIASTIWSRCRCRGSRR
jgi:hypothetical protein